MAAARPVILVARFARTNVPGDVPRRALGVVPRHVPRQVPGVVPIMFWGMSVVTGQAFNIDINRVI